MNAPRATFDGILPVNKPAGPTSHDVVMRLRRILGQRSVGHTGTLDPLATGLLLVCLGKATKVARFVSDFDKTYIATIGLGRTSETLDAEGLDLSEPAADVSKLRREQVETVLAEFKGVVCQKVPALSAVRVDGERLYKTARRGEEVELPEREVRISAIELTSFELPTIEVRVTCSKGTYLRSLADDIGRRLGCGAYLAGLIRSQVGRVKLDRALTPDEIEKRHRDGALAESILELDEVLDFGAIRVSDEFAGRISSGRLPASNDILGTQGTFDIGDRVFLKDTAGRILAVGTAGFSSAVARTGGHDNLFKYIRVLS